MDKEAAYELLAKLRAPLKTIGLLLHSDPHTTPPQPPGNQSTATTAPRNKTPEVAPAAHLRQFTFTSSPSTSARTSKP
ncbi:hypothetical protein N7499_010830 [Penicillium canescens]|nr:hypothetical protein N7499_010830 [Penicillium canescens]